MFMEGNFRMTYMEFENTKPQGVTDEEYLRSLPMEVLVVFAVDMRLHRNSLEYRYILDILDVLVPQYEISGKEC